MTILNCEIIVVLIFKTNPTYIYSGLVKIDDHVCPPGPLPPVIAHFYCKLLLNQIFSVKHDKFQWLENIYIITLLMSKTTKLEKKRPKLVVKLN